jgi:hypothetical protein
LQKLILCVVAWCYDLKRYRKRKFHANLQIMLVQALGKNPTLEDGVIGYSSKGL